MKVCIKGRNSIQSSSALWHFIQGHLLETLFLLHSHSVNYSDPNTQVYFEVSRQTRMYMKFFDFYNQVFHNRPLIANCDGIGNYFSFPKLEWHVNRTDARLEFKSAQYTSLISTCKSIPHLLPQNRDSERQRFATFVMRQGKRRILNRKDVEIELHRFSSSHNLQNNSYFLEKLSIRAQVSLLQRTQLLVSYHGSGIGAGHIWMPINSIVIEALPPKWPYCIFASCAYASNKRYILSSQSGDNTSDVWKRGGFTSPFAGPEHSRSFDASLSLEVASRILRGEVVNENACGRRAIQVWESTEKIADRPSV